MAYQLLCLHQGQNGLCTTCGWPRFQFLANTREITLASDQAPWTCCYSLLQPPKPLARCLNRAQRKATQYQGVSSFISNTWSPTLPQRSDCLPVPGPNRDTSYDSMCPSVFPYSMNQREPWAKGVSHSLWAFWQNSASLSKPSCGFEHLSLLLTQFPLPEDNSD